MTGRTFELAPGQEWLAGCATVDLVLGRRVTFDEVAGLFEEALHAAGFVTERLSDRVVVRLPDDAPRPASCPTGGEAELEANRRQRAIDRIVSRTDTSFLIPFAASGVLLETDADGIPQMPRAEAAFVSVERDGAVVGYRIKELQAGGFLARLGFREGDIVLSVAGHPATGMTEAVAGIDEIYRSVGRTFTVQVERQGELVDLEYFMGAPESTTRPFRHVGAQ